MIHYSCDRCKRSIDPENEIRYSVRIEIQAHMDCGDTGIDEQDHLLELDEILERLEDSECDEIGDDVYQRQRYDLCSDCHSKYINNPLAVEPQVQFEFSDN